MPSVIIVSDIMPNVVALPGFIDQSACVLQHMSATATVAANFVRGYCPIHHRAGKTSYIFSLLRKKELYIKGPVLYDFIAQ
jgi:hypothetical protein